MRGLFEMRGRPRATAIGSWHRTAPTRRGACCTRTECVRNRSWRSGGSPVSGRSTIRIQTTRETAGFRLSCGSKFEKFPQPPRLHAAHGNFGVLLIVHSELVARLEPRHHFFNAVDVHQERAMHAPEHLAIQIRL